MPTTYDIRDRCKEDMGGRGVVLLNGTSLLTSPLVSIITVVQRTISPVTEIPATYMKTLKNLMRSGVIYSHIPIACFIIY